MQCPQCQHANRDTAKFCEDCGARLIHLCFHCGHDVSSQAKFCEECGASLTGSVATNQPESHESDAESRFQALLPVVIGLLRGKQRITYRTLKYALSLDNTLLEEIRKELTFRQLVRDEVGEGLVWTGEALASDASIVTVAPSQPASVETSVIPSDTVPAPLPLVTPAASETKGSTTSPEVPPTDVSSDKPVVVPEPIRAAPDAERRQLTVMFCDLVGSTELSGKLDPEDLREVVRAYQQTAAEVIERYEGHIAQYLGDGLLIYFGWPQAHENDAERAVFTGLGITEAIATLNTRLAADNDVQLAVRIGIHTGPVVVGEMGGGNRHENLALGETPNIAARLEGLAQPNTSVISPVTAQLVQRSFVLEEFGPHELKGVVEPMRLWRVVGLRETVLEAAGTTGDGFEVLVGRDEEIGLLLRRWQQSQDGLGQVVLISGEAGIGKSSLVSGLRNHVRQEGHTQIVLRCSPYHVNSALYPFIEHAQRVLGWQSDDTSETRLAKLEQGLESTSLVLKEAVPLLASLLALPLPEWRYPALTLSPQQQRQQTQDVMVAWLLEEAERRPVLAVWEDLHWADPSTLEHLSLLVEQAPTVAMLHVLTFRPEFESPWAARSHLTPLALNRLERSQVKTLITRLAGGKLLPAEVVEHIVAKTDGVPLYVEELTKMLLASDLLREDTAHYELTGPLLSIAIPDTLQDLLMARLDQLGRAKEIAQLGAVVGREFTYDMARAIASLDESTLQEGLAQLVTAELLYQRGRPPQATYIFKHALIRDAAYQSLLYSTRQEVHQCIVQVLETTFPEMVATQPAMLAHHLEGAGLYCEAVAAWRQAGAQLRARSAYRESAASFEHALEAHQHLPTDRNMQTLAIDLRFDLRNAFFLLGEDERVLHHLHEAEALAEALDDQERMGYAASFMAQHFNAMGDYNNAIVSGQRVLSLATARGEFPPQIGAHQHIGMAHYFLGDYRQAIASFRHNMTALEGDLAYEFFGRSFLPSVVSGAYLSQSLAALGDFNEGMAQARECLRIADVVNNLSSQVFAGCTVGSVCIARGDLSRALASLERTHRLCQDADLLNAPFLLTIAHLGYAYTLSGRVVEAIPLLEQAVEQSAQSGPYNPTLWFAWLGETYRLAGRPNDALTLTARALDLSRTQKERGHEALVLRHLGDLALHGKPSGLDQAQAHYQQSLALANELAMRSLQAHCHLGLGTLYSQTGEAEQARAELSMATELYRDIEMTFWLSQAEAALAEVQDIDRIFDNR